MGGLKRYFSEMSYSLLGASSVPISVPTHDQKRTLFLYTTIDDFGLIGLSNFDPRAPLNSKIDNDCPSFTMSLTSLMSILHE